MPQPRVMRKWNPFMSTIWIYLSTVFFILCLTTKLNGNEWQCIDWSRLREPEMKPFQFLLPHRIHLILNYCRSVEILYHRRQRWQFGWIERKMFQTYKIKSLKLIEGETSFSVFINRRLYISRNSISLRIIQIDWILNSRIDLFFSAIFLAN